MTRLTEKHPVYFVEEPVLRKDVRHPVLEVQPASGITILVPVFPDEPCYSGGFGCHNNPLISDLLSDFFGQPGLGTDVVAWYYTPMALGALPDALSARVSVYDAMDELGNFRHAPSELKVRERSLMQLVNLVFSGGPSLHDARKHLHRHTYCFPSGVDVEHFRSAPNAAPEDISRADERVIGFYGVLDERVDFELIGGIADLRPEWTIAMIGPLVKIEESELAHRQNIRYPGMRAYAELPRYLARFDAAILPFANNEATRFISPTKTLEYLAAGKPVVSTPVRDVVRLYGDVVEIADTPEGFVSAIERLWAESDADRSMRQQQVEDILARHHWDAIAAEMGTLISEALQGRHDSRTPDPLFTGPVTATGAALPAPAD